MTSTSLVAASLVAASLVGASLVGANGEIAANGFLIGCFRVAC